MAGTPLAKASATTRLFMKLETLRDLLIHELKDLYSAEKQLLKALPKAAKAATNADLKAGFANHLDETKEHVARLEEILPGLGANTKGPMCKGMAGLIEEASHLIEEEPDPEILDAGLICGAQKMEHYEIAGYGCARTFAELLGEDDAARTLQQTLDEEHETDLKLTELAMTGINVSAADNEESEESGKPRKAPAKKTAAKNSSGKSSPARK